MHNFSFNEISKLDQLKSTKPIRFFRWNVDEKSISGKNLRIFDNRDHPKYPKSHIYLHNVTSWKYSSLVKLIDMINNNYTEFDRSLKHKHKKPKRNSESKRKDLDKVSTKKSKEKAEDSPAADDVLKMLLKMLLPR